MATEPLKTHEFQTHPPYCQTHCPQAKCKLIFSKFFGLLVVRSLRFKMRSSPNANSSSTKRRGTGMFISAREIVIKKSIKHTSRHFRLKKELENGNRSEMFTQLFFMLSKPSMILGFFTKPF